MSDIYDIKPILAFLPSIQPDTWYVIVICLSTYAIYEIILAIFRRRERVASIQAEQEKIRELPIEYIRRLDSLDTHDHEFFGKIGQIIREFLELSGAVQYGKKKTSREIREEFGDNPIIHKFFEDCTRYTYSPETSSDTLGKERIKTEAKSIIKNFVDR